MKKIIAIALIAIVAITSVFATDPTNKTVQVKATKAIVPVVFTLSGKDSAATEWSTSVVNYTTMPDSFTVNFKVDKAISNYTGNQANMTFTVTVGALKLSSLDSGWVENSTMATPAIENLVGGTNNNGTITSSSIEIKGYKAASTPMTFDATYTCASTLYAGSYVSDVTLTYTAP